MMSYIKLVLMFTIAPDPTSALQLFTNTTQQQLSRPNRLVGTNMSLLNQADRQTETQSVNLSTLGSPVLTLDGYRCFNWKPCKPRNGCTRANLVLSQAKSVSELA